MIYDPLEAGPAFAASAFIIMETFLRSIRHKGHKIRQADGNLLEYRAHKSSLTKLCLCQPSSLPLSEYFCTEMNCGPPHFINFLLCHEQ